MRSPPSRASFKPALSAWNKNTTHLIRRSTFELLKCLLFSLGFYFTAQAYILWLHNKFVVAFLVGVLIPQDNYKLIYPLGDYIFTAGLVEGLGDLISWETARAR
jgi:hypothetical protein